MKDRDKQRFHDNFTWFNQFFDGMRQIYEYIVDLLPEEFFCKGFLLNSGNYYFPRLKAAPSLPAYYALLLEGKTHALQAIAVIDAYLFTHNGPFVLEPSLITVLHTQPEKYGWINDYALNVIKNQNVVLTTKERGAVVGKINAKFPADFIAFQVQYEKFSENTHPQNAVQKYIVDPINAYLAT
jgi:hypothetical protein